MLSPREASPGLLQAVIPGDMFIIKYSEESHLHMCLWSSPYIGEDDEECCHVGTLPMSPGCTGIQELWYHRDTPVWFVRRSR